MENTQQNSIIEQNLNVLRKQFPKATWALGGIDHGSVIYTCSNGKEGKDFQTFPIFMPKTRVLDEKVDKLALEQLQQSVNDLLDDDKVVDYHFSIA